MIFIFAGPTISEEQVHSVLENVVVMPPASAGDVYRVCQSSPEAIGIIDGYFDGVPSVWHKEILWAMDAGVAVFGASSMGALRAAELHAFGMVGVGKIFEAFRDGMLEDDDEVALQHGPQEVGFAPLSEPMVNIRATLKSATERKIIDDALASRLIDLAKARFYQERSWDRLIGDALRIGIEDAIIERLKIWLEHEKIDQKRIDAFAMLTAMKEREGAGRSGSERPFKFQHTVMWEQLTKTVTKNAMPTQMKLVLDCLRCDPERYQHYRSLAAQKMARKLDGEESDQAASSEQIAQAITQLRTQYQLYTGALFNDWLCTNDMTLRDLEEKIAAEIALDAFIKAHPQELKRLIFDELKADERAETFFLQAKRIQNLLESTGLANATCDDIDLSSIQLQMWYFETLLKIPMPDDLDYYLDKHDFADRREFETMMVCQFEFWRSQQD